MPDSPLERRLSRIASDVWGCDAAPLANEQGGTAYVSHSGSRYAVRMEGLKRAVPLDALPENYAVSALQSPCDVLHAGAVVLEGVPYMHAVHAVRALARCDAGLGTLQSDS